MSMSNQELAKRADIALADLNSNGGLLSPEQSNQFIDDVIERPTILNQARVIRMKAPSRKINRTGFASRILHNAPQGTSPYAADDGSNDRRLAAEHRSKPTTSQITLNTKEVIAEVTLPYEVLEDNIEGQSFESHVMRLIAERAAEDLEELALNGDASHASDTYLALLDGLLESATSNVVNNASAGPNPSMFSAGMLAMPQKYLRNLNRLRHFVTVADTIRYRENVSRRSTGYGDAALTQNADLNAYGVKIDGSPLMPADSALFTFPENILFGIQRDIMVETDKDIRSREIIIVLTARIDVKWDDESAVVKFTNIN